MDESENLLLAIEAGIEGGSLCLLDETGEFDFWIGKSGMSKAEDVLEGVRYLLKNSRFKSARIKTIAVSTDVGSATGLKIGLATAKGLSKAFGSPIMEISLWEAIAASITLQTNEARIIWLPLGKKGFGRRKLFHGKFDSEMTIFDHKRFEQELVLGDKRNVNFKSDANFALYIAKFASDNELKLL